MDATCFTAQWKQIFEHNTRSRLLLSSTIKNSRNVCPQSTCYVASRSKKLKRSRRLIAPRTAPAKLTKAQDHGVHTWSGKKNAKIPFADLPGYIFSRARPSNRSLPFFSTNNRIHLTMKFSQIFTVATVAVAVQAANNSSSSAESGAGAQLTGASVGAGLALAGVAALLF